MGNENESTSLKENRQENKKPKKEQKVNYIDGLKAEFHKIVWPNKKLLGKQSVAVIFAAIVIGCVIAAIDWVMQVGLTFIVG